jgi:hypothetical protein
MLATYTIYEPQARACPLKYDSGNFWGGPDQDLSLTIKNDGLKTIKSVILTPAMFLSRLDLRTSSTEWISPKPVPPGGSEVLSQKNYLFDTKALTGWSFYPRVVQYTDGTKWEPKFPGECFHVFWRDQEHPDLVTLPPLQIEVNAD